MDVNAFLRVEKERIYLKTINGVWKKFDNILEETLDEKIIKFKKRRFRIEGRLAWGARHMGRDGDEIWIYAKLPQKEIEKTVIYEIVGLHFEDAELIKNEDDNSSFLENIAEKIWQNKNCHSIGEALRTIL